MIMYAQNAYAESENMQKNRAIPHPRHAFRFTLHLPHHSSSRIVCVARVPFT